jgi:hypothetical protein
MRGRIIEPIGLGTVGAVYDPGGTRVLNPRNCLLTRVDSLWKDNMLRLMASCLAIDLVCFRLIFVLVQLRVIDNHIFKMKGGTSTGRFSTGE